MQKIILNHTNLVGEQSKDLESVLPIGGISNFTNKAIDDEEIDEDENSFPEGKEKYRLHRFKERNRKLIASAKQRLNSIDPEMKCQICKFSFLNRYGEIGANFIEAHHVFPISALTKETPMRIEDLAMVCSNCHRMLHRKRPWLNIDDLKKLIK